MCRTSTNCAARTRLLVNRRSRVCSAAAAGLLSGVLTASDNDEIEQSKIAGQRRHMKIPTSEGAVYSDEVAGTFRTIRRRGDNLHSQSVAAAALAPMHPFCETDCIPGIYLLPHGNGIQTARRAFRRRQPIPDQDPACPRRTVISVTSGGQFSRTGMVMVPSPMFV